MSEGIETILEDPDFTLLEGPAIPEEYRLHKTGDESGVPDRFTLLDEPSNEPGADDSGLRNRTITGTLAAAAIAGLLSASSDSSPPTLTLPSVPTDLTLPFREALHSIDLGLVEESEATANFIEEHGDSVETIAEMYGVPVRALEMLISRELGYDSQNGALGIMNKLDEQRLKALINYNRAVIGIEVDKVNIREEDGTEGEYILGPSLSWINIKPGLVTRAVVDVIQDPSLRQRLLETYDEEQRHADSAELARVLDEDFVNSLHVVSAVMSYWLGTISQVEFIGADSIEEEEELRDFLLSTVGVNYYPNAKKDILYYDPETGLLFGQYYLLNFDESKWPDLRDPPVTEPLENEPN